MLITDRGQTIRTPVGDIRETGRNAQGVKVMSVDEDERVVAIEPVGETRAAAVLDGNSLMPDAPAEDAEVAVEDAEGTLDDEGAAESAPETTPGDDDGTSGHEPG